MADLVTLWSNITDFTNSVAEFPGVLTKTVFDGLTGADDFYGADGDYLVEQAGVSYVNNGSDGTLTLSSTTGLVAGMYAYVLPDTPASNDEGYYHIDSVDSGTQITVVSVGLGLGGAGAQALTINDTVDVVVGGVSDAFTSSTTLQAELDLIGPNCSASPTDPDNNLDILCHGATATTLTSTIDIDAISGSTTTRVRLVGTNSSFVDDGTQIEMKVGVDLTNGLFEYVSTATHITTKNFILHCEDGGFTADYGVNQDDGTDGSLNHKFINCRFTEAGKHGAQWTGIGGAKQGPVFIGCEFDNNVESGFANSNFSTRGGPEFHNCTVRDNGQNGIVIGISSFTTTTSKTAIIDSCLIYGNGTTTSHHGIKCEANAAAVVITNNTIYNNTGDGINCVSNASATQKVIINNTSSNNGAYGYNFNGNTRDAYFSNNHSYNNTTAHTDIVTDANFADFGEGNNLGDSGDTIDPLFTNAGTGDFTLQSGSPLREAGVGGSDIGALQFNGAGAGGGVMPFTGLLS